MAIKERRPTKIENPNPRSRHPRALDPGVVTEEFIRDRFDEQERFLKGPLTSTRAPAIEHPSRPATLREYFDNRKQQVLRQQYDVMGQLDCLVTPRGAMEFGRSGPTLAAFHDGSLGFITEWPGLPDQFIPTGKLCPDCQAKCDECNGKGKRTCVYPQCGGDGKIRIKTVACPGTGCLKEKGKYNPDCQQCGGCGMIIEPEDCPTCKGTGIARCALCRGSGRMSTGYAHGARKKLGRPAPKLCRSCLGHGLERRQNAQVMKKFIAKRQDGMTVVGPITAMVFHTVGDFSLKFNIIDVKPDQDMHPMFLFLESPLPGAMMHLMGGVPILRSRQ